MNDFLPEFKGSAYIETGQLPTQKELGWPGFHPEDFCHRCGIRNVSWSVGSDLWSHIMGPEETIKWDGIICVACFSELFEIQYPKISWKLEPNYNTVGGRLYYLNGVLDSTHKEGGKIKMDEGENYEGEIPDSKFKRAVKSSVPYILVGSASLIVSAVLYSKYNATRAAAYTNYLESKADLFAEALDKTTEAIITSLTPKK